MSDATPQADGPPDAHPAARRTAWMYERKLGLTTHYFPRSPAEVDAVAEGFDVERVAAQCAEAGAGWFMLTLHHQPWLMQAPNETLDALTGTTEYTAARDLPAELHAALDRHGIRLLLYLNLRIDPEGNCLPPIKKALGPCPPEEETIANVAAVYRTFAERYGPRVSGWWVDGVWTQTFKALPAERRERWFVTLAAALRSTNPDAAVAFNPGVKDVFWRYSRENDFLAGEANELLAPPSGRFLDGAQWHLWPYLGPWWGSNGTRFEDAELCDWARRVVAGGGVLSFEVGTRGLRKTGRQDPDPVQEGPVGAIDPKQVAQVRAVAAALGRP
jgi:hypothetical protein